MNEIVAIVALMSGLIGAVVILRRGYGAACLQPGWIAAYVLGALGWLAIYELWGRGAVVVVALIGAWLAVVAGEAMHRYPDGDG